MNATEELERIDSPASVQQAADRLAAVREAVGDDMDVAVDLHGRATKTMATRLIAALEPHDPFFVEEPILPEYNDALPDLARQTTVPIATGERMYTRMDFKQVLEANAVDVVQPDLSHAGGITETHKIAAMADAYDVSLAPHCPLGPIALAACLQVDAAAPNALIQEQSLDIHYNRGADLLDYLEDPGAFAFDDGYVTPPPDPGLGIAIDEDVVRERAGVDWDGAVGRYRPTWRRGDGSVTEW